MEIFMISATTLISYVKFGILMNVLSIFVIIIASLIKMRTFKDEDMIDYLAFSHFRSEYIKEHSTFKKLLHASFILMPMYIVWINSVFLYHAIKRPGLNGLLMGIIKRDEIGLLKMIDYKIIENNK